VPETLAYLLHTLEIKEEGTDIHFFFGYINPE